MTATAKTTKRLTPKQWAEAEALWESGSVTYEDLIKKFGLAQSSFERHFKKRGVVKGAKAAATKARVEEKLAAAALDQAAIIAARVNETKEQHYTMAANLAKLVWSEILEAKRSGAEVATRINNIKALNAAMDALGKARAERYAILGLDRPDAVDPDELPELVISELTQEQIDELRRRDEADLEEGGPAPQAADLDPEEADPDDDDGDAVVEEN